MMAVIQAAETILGWGSRYQIPARKNLMKRIPGSEKGAAIVEFAIILPLLLIITFGIIEFGIFLFNKQVITNASREGARAGIVARSPRLQDFGTPSINEVVQHYCGSLITFAKVKNPPTTTVTGYSPTANFGTDLQVQVDYAYAFSIIPKFLTGYSTSTITATTVMKYE
jgi:Flp pilus assembly protein TadG